MNDKTRGRHTVTKEYLDHLESQRRTGEPELNYDMDSSIGEAARDAADRELERQIGRVRFPCSARMIHNMLGNQTLEVINPRYQAESRRR